MKKRFLAITLGTLFAAVLTSAADSSWTGYISDSLCGVKGAHEGSGECARSCVKEKGAKFVFVNDADKKVYTIDAQDKAEKLAGTHVVVKGAATGDAIKVTSIEAAK